MRIILNYFTILLLLFTFSIGYAQRKLSKNERIGDAYIQRQHYAFAITYYTKAYKKRKISEIAYKIGQAYFLLRNFSSAEEWYKKSVKDSTTELTRVKEFAHILMSSNQYDSAKYWWQKYYSLSKDKNSLKYISACDSAIFWINNPSKSIKVKNLLSINSEYSEINPGIFKDGLIFATTKPGMIIEKNNPNTGSFYFDLFSSSCRQNGEWTKPSFFGFSINSPAHETSACFDSTFSTIYFTRGNVDTTELLKMKIYKAEKTSLGWSSPKEFFLNDSLSSFGHQFMSKNEELFLFSSNMVGGFGGNDLYISYKTGNTWSVPENLGDKINTSENEYFPFLDSKGILYFTSNGHLSMGGYDIFKARFKKKNGWSVENMKVPVNSPCDDFGFVLDEKKSKGYFSSNRLGGLGLEDIYEVIFEKLK